MRIRIAAALIEDGAGRMLLVRKAGTTVFMQAGGKIEGHEQPIAALRRELAEELNWTLDPGLAVPLGRFTAPAANEPDCTVEAELFRVRVKAAIEVAAEIAEAVWVNADEARAIPLAPLTERHVLPLFEQEQRD